MTCSRLTDWQLVKLGKEYARLQKLLEKDKSGNVFRRVARQEAVVLEIHINGYLVEREGENIGRLYKSKDREKGYLDAQV